MRNVFTYLLIFVSCAVLAQQKDRELPKGNIKFADKKYAEAEAQYRISKSKNPQKATSAYNLGNSIYRQDQVSEARTPYLKAIATAKTRPQKHYAYHNLGNVYMKAKNYTAAVEAYKNALRNNPSDEETRYNYALAKKFLKDNPPPKDKNKDKKDDKKDDKKNQDKKDQDKKDDKKDGDKDKMEDKPQDQPGKNDQDKKDEQPKDNDQPKPNPGGISKQRLENLLEAVNNEEKKVQEKVNAKKVKAPPMKTEKDW
jgi:tetratricopeptide (TPR) repeat protein